MNAELTFDAEMLAAAGEPVFVILPVEVRLRYGDRAEEIILAGEADAYADLAGQLFLDVDVNVFLAVILGIRRLDDVHFLEVVHVHQSLAARVDAVVVVAVAREEAELSSYDNVFRALVAGDVNYADVEEGRFVHFVENIDSDAVVRLLFGKEDLGSADGVGIAQRAEVIP